MAESVGLMTGFLVKLLNRRNFPALSLSQSEERRNRMATVVNE
jgi:hypothetical protein